MATEGPIYNCVVGANYTCPEDCVSLAECDNCGCVVEDTGGGPWGKAMDVILCLLPIIFLLVATLKPKPLPTTQSLPLAALIMLLVRLMYLGSDPLLCCASIIAGLHEAMSPITIVGGAMLLFETLESTLCMPYMMREMKALTQGHHVAELMLLFCFAYMIEGASGFGTPGKERRVDGTCDYYYEYLLTLFCRFVLPPSVALGAPMLVSLGYPKFESVVTLLLMNTFATVWGAAGRWLDVSPCGATDDTQDSLLTLHVMLHAHLLNHISLTSITYVIGTPIWFGFSGIALSEDELIDVSYKSGVALAFSAYLLMPFVMLTACSWEWFKANIVFFFLSLTTCIAPSLGLSFAAYEFPSLLGGMVSKQV